MALVGFDTHGEEDEAEEQDKQHHRLDESAFLNEKGTDCSYELFAEDRDNFPVVGEFVKPIVQESIPFFHAPVLQNGKLFSED